MRVLSALAIFSFLLAAPQVHADGATFHCIIKSLHSLDTRGKLKRSKNMDNMMFSVERATGRIEAEFHDNYSPTVIWDPGKTGDTSSPYIAEDVLVGARTARYSVLQIQEHVNKNNKPFVWHRWDGILTGLCK